MSNKSYILLLALFTLIGSAFISPNHYRTGEAARSNFKPYSKPIRSADGIPTLDEIGPMIPLIGPDDTSLCCSLCPGCTTPVAINGPTSDVLFGYSSDAPEFTLGVDKSTSELIKGGMAYQKFAAGYNGINVPHIYIQVQSFTPTPGNKSAEAFIIGDGRDAFYIIGGIRQTNFLSGECEWCDCMESKLATVEWRDYSDVGRDLSSIPLVTAGPDDTSYCCTTTVVTFGGPLKDRGVIDRNYGTGVGAIDQLLTDYGNIVIPDSSICCSLLTGIKDILPPDPTGGGWIPGDKMYFDANSNTRGNDRLDLTTTPAAVIMSVACGYAVEQGRRF